MKRKGMSPDDIHNKLMQLQHENEQLKKTSVSMEDVEKLIEENRKMKLEIYKLQVTQYGHSEIDNTDSKSDFSVNSNPLTKTSLNEEINRFKPSSGF
jgi:regulator of replication initiation timing